MNKELSIAIVKGRVAEYAKNCAMLEKLTTEELVQILSEIIELLKK